MDFHGHVAGGFAAFALLAWAGFGFSPALFAATMLGAVLPDADHEKSKLFRAIKGTVAILAGATVFFIFLKSNELPSALLAGVVSGIAAGLLIRTVKPRHRGIMHSFAACFLYAAAVAATAGALGGEWFGMGTGAAAGFASHLVLDAEFKLA